MNNAEEIKILWEGPFSIEEITDNKIDKKYDVTARSKGLYQVYGSHPLYGDGVLVYIGRTKESFQSRLNSRWVIENGSDSENVQIYLGTIFSDSEKIENMDNMIEKSEVLLINAMKPAYNSSNIQSANEDFINDKFIIHNEGNYRNLYPVLDSKYFWEPYRNFLVVNEISEIFDIKIDDDDEYYGFELNENKDLNIHDKYTLWFGVEYKTWNELKIPLVIQIYSEDEKVMKRIKELSCFKFFTSDGDDERIDYFHIPFYTEFLNLNDNKLRDTFKNEVEKIINQIKL